jgi:hypothetical protein
VAVDVLTEIGVAPISTVQSTVPSAVRMRHTGSIAYRSAALVGRNGGGGDGTAAAAFRV